MAEDRLQLPELPGLESRRRLEPVPELEELDRRHRLDHVELGDDQLEDRQDALEGGERALFPSSSIRCRYRSSWISCLNQSS